jgi:hypothetical protein
MLEIKRPDAPAHRHEGKDVAFWKIIAATAVFVIAIGVVALLVAWLYQYLGEETPAESGLGAPLRGTVKVPPPPRLQPNPPLELKKFRESEDSALHTYGLIDPEAGTVHIPIERAIELTAQRGLPSRPPSPPQPPSGPATTQSSGVAAAPGSTQYIPGPGPYADAPPAPGAAPQNGLMTTPSSQGTGKR